MAADGEKKGSLSTDQAQYHETQPRKHSVFSLKDVREGDVAAVFENPLARVPEDELMRNVEEFCEKFELMEHLEDMKKGALVSKSPDNIEDATFLNDQEKETIIRERTHKWDHPWMLYWLCGKTLI